MPIARDGASRRDIQDVWSRFAGSEGNQRFDDMARILFGPRFQLVTDDFVGLPVSVGSMGTVLSVSSFDATKKGHERRMGPLLWAFTIAVISSSARRARQRGRFERLASDSSADFRRLGIERGIEGNFAGGQAHLSVARTQRRETLWAAAARRGERQTRAAGGRYQRPSALISI